ncbi:MAG TPA: hypothetical protein VMC07_02115 [Candidatus Omnitrophota bacterium]|nr:hypothetical protein [Candidatus Omnitrophota bacterium]
MALMNKRGDISITLLVIGVFAVCALAILSFILNSQGSQGSFANPEIFENASIQLENYYFYVNSGLTPQEAAQKVGGEIQNNVLILNVQQKDLSAFVAGKTILSVQYRINLGD